MKRLVISNYKENIEWIQRLDKSKVQSHLLYKKDNNYLSHYLDYEKEDENNVNLANVGREAHTYLIHIVKNYYNLYEHEIFCQGNPFEHCFNFLDEIYALDDASSFKQFGHLESIIEKEKIKNYVSDFNFKYLNNLIEKDPLWTRANFFNIDSIHLDLFGKEMPDVSIMKPYAQFVVSKKTIMSHDIETYKRLLDYFNDNINYNVMAWHMEYFWHILFRESIDLKYNPKNNIFKF